MGLLILSKVKVGMKLAQPVENSKGKVLFGAKNTITEKHLKTLRAWGVTEVNIEDVGKFEVEDKDEKLNANVDGSTQKEVENEIDWLFQKTDKNDPVIMELHRLSIKNRLRKKGG